MAQPPSTFQQKFWDGPGSSKVFTHTVRWDWIAAVPKGGVVLDYGCGYGRLVREFRAKGFTTVYGVDPSAALVRRGASEVDGLLVMADPPRVPTSVPPADLVILFAVLTCVPHDDAQRNLVRELWRSLKPGGLLYVADFLLSGDRRCYDDLQPDGLPYGTFATMDGATLRHHTLDHLRDLIGGEIANEQLAPVLTMNGGTASGVQLVSRKPVDYAYDGG